MILTAAVLVGGSAPAFAAAPEQPTTEKATLITTTGATLNGLLNPGKKGQPGSYQFDYAPAEGGECNAAGLFAPASPAFATGNEKEAVSELVTGLEANKEYAYCVLAFSLSLEASTFAPEHFTTLKAAPGLSGEKASGVGSTKATLEAQLNPNNEATSYTFEYASKEKAGNLEGVIVKLPVGGPVEGGTNQTIGTPAIEGLSPGATYFYRVVATNGTGTTDATVTSFVTAIAPEKPVTTGAKSVSSTEETLEGTLNPGTTAKDGYYFAYSNPEGSSCDEGPVTSTEPEATVTAKHETVTVAGLQPHEKYVFCMVATNDAEPSETAQSTTELHFETPAVPPAIEEQKSSEVTSESAKLETTVNPEHQETTCQFEYGTDSTLATHTTVPCPAALGDGGAGVTASVALSGLKFETPYYFRVAATNASGTTTDTAIGEFKTENTVAPEVTEPYATGVSADSAELHAYINPGGGDTKYRFEYGPNTTYGNSAPAGEGDAGKGTASVLVESGTIQGLTSATEYHYRVVATNAAAPGGVPGPDHTFTTHGPSGPLVLPDGRQWEQVSPVDKHGARIEGLTVEGGAIQAAEDGTAMAYVANAPIVAHPEGNLSLAFSPVLSVRGPNGGWSSRDLAAPHVGEPHGLPVGELDEYYAFNQDLSKGILEPLGSPPLAPGLTSENNLFVRENLREGAGADYTPLADNQNTPAGTTYGNRAVEYQVASANLEHVIVYARTQLTSTVEGGGLYEWNNGTFAPISVFPNGEFCHVCSAGKQEINVRNAVSENGERVFWEAPAPGDNQASLYMRENAAQPQSPLADGAAAGTGELHEGSNEVTDAVATRGSFQVGQTLTDEELPDGTTITNVDGSTLTISVSVAANRGGNHELDAYSPCTVPADACTVQIDLPQGSTEPPSGFPEAHFEYATPDGERVYFKDTQKLTPNSTASTRGPQGQVELYEYNTKTGVLTDITPNPEGLTGPGSEVQGVVIGASNNGEYVYLVAKGTLSGANAEGHTPGSAGEKEQLRIGSEGEPLTNLYVIHTTGETRTTSFVTVLAENHDLHDWERENNIQHESELQGVTSRVSPDGQYIAFMSDLPLTGYDNIDAAAGVPDEEVYEYSAATQRIVCASCNPTGERPHGVHDPSKEEVYKGTGDSEGIGLLVDRIHNWTNRWLAGSIPGWNVRKLGLADYQSRYLTDSGRLFFNSPDALVPSDTNGKEDVYEYEPEGVGPSGAGCGPAVTSASDVFVSEAAGCVGLISSGTSPKESAFLDASAAGPGGEEGEDVFFLTASKLVSQDVDSANDVYDAHVCSAGAPCPSPVASPPPCTTADSCRAAPTSQPSVFGESPSETFSAPGSLAPPAPAVVPPKKKAAPKCRKGFTKNKKGACIKSKKKKARAKKSSKSNRGAKS